MCKHDCDTTTPRKPADAGERGAQLFVNLLGSEPKLIISTNATSPREHKLPADVSLHCMCLLCRLSLVSKLRPGQVTQQPAAINGIEQTVSASPPSNASVVNGQRPQRRRLPRIKGQVAGIGCQGSRSARVRGHRRVDNPLRPSQRAGSKRVRGGTTIQDTIAIYKANVHKIPSSGPTRPRPSTPPKRWPLYAKFRKS